MRVLVVGASGYLGTSVCRVLESDGHQVVGLGRRRAGRRCDVTRPGLGLSGEALVEMGEIDVVVACFGSVDMGGDPSGLVDVHVRGTSNVLDLAVSLGTVNRVVYVSSILALGRSSGQVTNRDLSRGQTFRNWYEYAKYRGELVARGERRIPVSILRLGTLLGPSDDPDLIPRAGGLVSVLPHLLRGLPLALARGGDYPVYVTDVDVAARVVAALAVDDESQRHCTYFDPTMPTLASTLEELCRPWGVMPTFVDLSAPAWLQRRLARRFTVDPEVTAYARPLFEFDPTILDSLPAENITSTSDYVLRTGHVLRGSDAPLTPTGGYR